MGIREASAISRSVPPAQWVVLYAWLASQELVRYWRAGPWLDPLPGQRSSLCHKVTRLVESAVAQGNPDLCVFSTRLSRWAPGQGNPRQSNVETGQSRCAHFRLRGRSALGALFGRLGGLLGWAVLGPSWEPLEASWGPLGGLSELLGAILGAHCGHLVVLGAILGRGGSQGSRSRGAPEGVIGRFGPSLRRPCTTSPRP